ncbi:methionyl aminopeptidase [Nematocida sp. AWRm77]|nr:methionyl aminopeptidase [Nematocida sp. AWRm77]
MEHEHNTPIVLNPVTPLPLERLLPANYSVDLSPLGRLEAAKIAAEAHRRVRYSVQQMIRPGVSLLEIAEHIENGTRSVLGEGYNKGIGFPTGLSLNSCAAHDTPNPSTPTVILKKDDVLKVDFGTQVDGYIIDSAFTVTFNPMYENLLLAARESVYECLKIAGPDLPLRQIGDKADEVIRSYEVEINGTLFPITPVVNLNGHSINRYKIHGGKYVPIVKNSSNKDYMCEDEFYAIETFTSTGKGYVNEKGDCSHYSIGNPNASSKYPKAQALLGYIKDTFHTLPFCKRYLNPPITNYELYVKNLVSIGALEDYPPLYDTPNSHVAQFEHTFCVKQAGIDVLSKGDDY